MQETVLSDSSIRISLYNLPLEGLFVGIVQAFVEDIIGKAAAVRGPVQLSQCG